MRSLSITILCGPSLRSPGWTPVLINGVVSDSFTQKIHQQTDLGGQMTVGRVDGPNRRVGLTKVIQHRDQSSPLQVFRNIVIGKLDQPQPAQSGVEERRSTVAAPIPLDFDGLVFAILEEAPIIKRTEQAILDGQFG